MPFLVQIFAGGKRKRVDEGDVLLLVSSNSKKRNNAAGAGITTTTTSASTACRKDHIQDAGRDGEGSRFLHQGSVDDGVINANPCHDPSTTTAVGVGTTVNNKKCCKTDDAPYHSFHAGDHQNHHATRPQNGNFYDRRSSSPSTSSSRRNPISSTGVAPVNKYCGDRSKHFNNDNVRSANISHHYGGNVSGSSFEVGVTSTNSHASTTVTNASIPSKPKSHSKGVHTSFEERCNQLHSFKEKF